MQSSLLLNMFTHNSELLIPPSAPCMSKDSSSSPLYFQPPGLGIIQLVEVPAPPRERPSPSFASSSFASSSSYVSSSSGASDEEESAASSSYCSSAEESSSVVSCADDTYDTRLSRVLAWRESSAKVDAALSLPPAAPAPAVPSKRKVDAACAFDSDDSDNASQSSKRSRASTSRLLAPWPGSAKRRFSEHSCPACDADFTCRQSLQQHGRDSTLPEACREAVQYDFEA